MYGSRSFLLVAVLAAAACSKDVTGPSAIVVDDVVITAKVPGNCRDGLACDPISAAYTTLGLITIHNNGGAPAYLRACGSTVAMTEQQLVDGQWKAVGPALDCAQGPPSIALAAGDSIQTNWWFAPGIRRLTVGVAATADLSGEALDASASFVVH
ncbi:MAG: hypothetical protein ACHQSE_02380 [Gemmatimonadales bacterium]